jgi:secreted Zn-dependent insulinase-like peptidase
LANQQIVLKRGVPKNFCYETRLIALLVQALRALKQENVGQEELQTIRTLITKELDKEALAKDVDVMPAWMKRIVKPMLKSIDDDGETMDK